MTIIAGIICNDGVVLASDSQTTTDEGKRCSAKKLHSVEFKDLTCLVAESGNATLSGYFLERLKPLAERTNVVGPRSVMDVAERAMKEAKNHFQDQSGHSSEAMHTLM